MTGHPYENAAPYRRWRQAMAGRPAVEIDPVVRTKFRISPEARVATFGSCFAQHIARHLRADGGRFFDAEPPHPLLPAELAARFGYGVYSARTGNIYSARQLLQTMQRAFGQFVPAEQPWEDHGRLFDPFRPAIQPGGFATRREYDLDQAQHLAALRHAFSSLDVLVFTLGLTETWISAEDGAAFPVCPGTAAGEFDPDRYRFRNFKVSETIADLRAAWSLLQSVNAAARLILTVSPVALMATACDTHVLTATIYSKSVLRAAAGEIADGDDRVMYFPSFEIITGAHARGRYFAQDLRSVTQDGVDHVMRLFAAHCLDGAPQASPAPERDTHFERLQEAVAVICEEEALDRT